MREEPMRGDAVEIRTMAAFGIAVVISQAALAIEPAASAHATDNWIAVANSPSREAPDWNNNVNRQAAETMALRLCAVLQKANNCRILTSGPNCVAVAWNADQPLNRSTAQPPVRYGCGHSGHSVERRNHGCRGVRQRPHSALQLFTPTTALGCSARRLQHQMV